MRRTIVVLTNTDFFAWVLIGARLRLLRERGHRVHLLAPLGRFRARLESLGIELHDLSMPRRIAPLQDAAAIVKTARLLRRIRPDVVNTFTSKAGVIGRIAGRIARVPVVVHTMQGLPFYDGQSAWKRRAYAGLERIGARFGDALLSENWEDLHTARRHRLTSARRVRWVGSGADFAEIERRVRAADVRAVRRSLETPDDAAVILAAARLEPVKRHDVLLDAIAALSTITGSPFVCWIAGEGPESERLESRARALGIADLVRFLGFVDDVPALLGACDLVALASEKEGIPHIALEAMAARRPIVATDVLGTREAVANGITGLLSPAGDAEAMARNLAYLIAHPVGRRRMGAAGHARAHRLFDDRRVVDRMEAAYESLMPAR